jgi:hypothetical protein
MACEEWNKLFKEYEIALGRAVPYPASTNGVPQSFADVLNAEKVQRTLHEKSAALQEHENSHSKLFHRFRDHPWRDREVRFKETFGGTCPKPPAGEHPEAQGAV